MSDQKFALSKKICGKTYIAEGTELINQERIKTLEEKKNYQGILKADTKEQGDGRKLRREFFKRTQKPLETNLYQQKYHKRGNKL